MTAAELTSWLLVQSRPELLVRLSHSRLDGTRVVRLGEYEPKISMAFRQRPEVRIIVRADSGFCRWRMLSWCERHGVDYIIGLARNKRLEALAAMAWARALFAATGAKQRHFAEVHYGARLEPG